MFKILFILFFNLFFTNADITKIALDLSQASYCDNSFDWSCPTCTENNILYTIIEKGGERCLLGYNKDINSIFISFRGSSDIENWIDNIQIRKSCPYNYNTSICIEKGFYKVYENIKRDVFNKLKEINNYYDTKNILLTGHSLGAAVSTLLAYDMVRNYNNYSVSLINFGSPRVGNSYFVYDFFKYKFYSKRVTHYYDIVPHLPQQLLDYLHIPNEEWYNEDNTHYDTCNDSITNEDNDCSNSCGPLHCTSINDHLYYLNVSMGTDNC